MHYQFCMTFLLLHVLFCQDYFLLTVIILSNTLHRSINSYISIWTVVVSVLLVLYSSTLDLKLKDEYEVKVKTV